MKEHSDLTVPQAFALAVHGHNNVIGQSGYSPFQWVRGASSSQEDLLPGLNPKKAFSGLLKLKEDARLAERRWRDTECGHTTTFLLQDRCSSHGLEREDEAGENHRSLDRT